jgi:thymidine phosphorylase
MVKIGHGVGRKVAAVLSDMNQPPASLIETVAAPQRDYVAAIDAAEVGKTCVELGSGRLLTAVTWSDTAVVAPPHTHRIIE